MSNDYIEKSFPKQQDGVSGDLYGAVAVIMKRSK